jgi:Protein of unknown function (DUF3096)
MTITLAHLPAIVALLAGILILIMPRLLNFIVAIYLIFISAVRMEPTGRSTGDGQVREPPHAPSGRSGIALSVHAGYRTATEHRATHRS